MTPEEVDGITAFYVPLKVLFLVEYSMAGIFKGYHSYDLAMKMWMPSLHFKSLTCLEAIYCTTETRLISSVNSHTSLSLLSPYPPTLLYIIFVRL